MVAVVVHTAEIACLESGDARDRARATLSPDEGRRYQSFSNVRARDEFLLGRALLRRLLGEHLGAHPGAVPITVSPGGRPELATATTGAPSFNLAHSNGLVALALASAPVGVDVERVRPTVPEGVAERVFAASEQAAVNAGGKPDPDAFFALWTLKEAYSKCRGLGFQLAPTRYAFDRNAPTPSLRVDADADDGSAYAFAEVRLQRSDGTGDVPYRLAVACQTTATLSLEVRGSARVLE